MAAAVGNYTNVNGGTATSVTIDVPSGGISGNMLVACVVVNAVSVTFTTPTGWTLIQEGGVATSSPSMASYYRVMDGTEPASYVFSNNTSAQIIGAMVVVTAGSTLTPTSSEQYNDTASTTATGATITPAANSLLLFFVGSQGSVNTISGYAIATSNPSWTELFDYSPSQSLALAYAVRPESTGTGSATATISASRRNAVHMVAIAPGPSVTITDTVVTSESVTALRDRLVSQTDTVVTSEDVDVDKAFPFTNQSKSSSSWDNQDK
jgi:hypothetical protein